MSSFMDVELVAVEEAMFPDGLTVTFDVIYAGETWCRSVIEVTAAAVARLGDEHAVVAAARDALLELLQLETGPVSFHLRLEETGATVLARGRPGH